MAAILSRRAVFLIREGMSGNTLRLVDPSRRYLPLRTTGVEFPIHVSFVGVGCSHWSIGSRSFASGAELSESSRVQEDFDFMEEDTEVSEDELLSDPVAATKGAVDGRSLTAVEHANPDHVKVSP